VLGHFKDHGHGRYTVAATTHYHGLAGLLDAPHWQVTGLTSYREKDLEAGAKPDDSYGLGWLYEHMDYRLQRVGPETMTPQDALLVARLLGLDKEIIERAEALLDDKCVS
jgi:DNA mismatch repair ATPase MutS